MVFKGISRTSGAEGCQTTGAGFRIHSAAAHEAGKPEVSPNGTLCILHKMVMHFCKICSVLIRDGVWWWELPSSSSTGSFWKEVASRRTSSIQWQLLHRYLVHICKIMSQYWFMVQFGVILGHYLRRTASWEGRGSHRWWAGWPGGTNGNFYFPISFLS